jgi:D-glycero-D-manno-heptose 1,7-bisphosphate phosphatase
MGKPLFLDRDGVLNRDVEPYVRSMEEFEIFPWTLQALTLLDRAGYEFFVVSNQQGVSLGITSPEELQAMEDALQALVRPSGFQFRRFYHATALDETLHPWRKPKPGMIHAAQEDFGLNLAGAFLIGDKWSDIEAGARAGLRPLLVLSGVTDLDADWTAWTYPPEAAFPTLLEAAQWILSTDA